jgi:hypothetical protein
LTPGDIEFLEVVASMLVATGVVVAVVMLDERRLHGRELERAWPASSRDAAFFGAWAVGWPAGCLVLLVHFASTRRSLRGVGLGLLWGLLLFLVAGVGPVFLVPALIEWLQL